MGQPQRFGIVDLPSGTRSKQPPYQFDRFIDEIDLDEHQVAGTGGPQGRLDRVDGAPDFIDLAGPAPTGQALTEQRDDLTGGPAADQLRAGELVIDHPSSELQDGSPVHTVARKQGAAPAPAH